MNDINLSLFVEVSTKLTLLALLAEGLTEAIKDSLPHFIASKISPRFISFCVSIGIAYQWDIDITILLNNRVDLVGSVMTGIIASRGANFVNDRFFSPLKKLKGGD